MDEAEYEEIVLAEEDLDEPRSFRPGAADRVKDEDLEPEDLAPNELTDADLRTLGYDDPRRPPDHDPAVDELLDEGLEETFPASDPVSINPGSS
jgi:hypothetical protein